VPDQALHTQPPTGVMMACIITPVDPAVRKWCRSPACQLQRFVARCVYMLCRSSIGNSQLRHVYMMECWVMHQQQHLLAAGCCPGHLAEPTDDLAVTGCPDHKQQAALHQDHNLHWAPPSAAHRQGLGEAGKHDDTCSTTSAKWHPQP
jgi:hypothetical protein